MYLVNHIVIWLSKLLNVYNYVYSCIDKNFCNDCSMAKFGVNVVVLVDNMPLVFFYFSPKPFKQNSCTAYTMKKNSDEASN